MGTFNCSVRLTSFDREKSVDVEALVDTGASYSVFPASLLTDLVLSQLPAWWEVLLAGVAMMVRDKYAVRLAAAGRTPASDSGWETPGPSHRQGPDSPQERRRFEVAEALDWAQCTGSRVTGRVSGG